MFFWNSLAFSMIQWMLAIWSLVLPFLNPAWISGSSWFTYCWGLAWSAGVHPKHHFVGEQNFPPWNVSLACGLFWAEKNQDSKELGRNLEIPPNCLKEFRWRGFPRIELSPEISAKIWARWGWRNSTGLRDQSLLCDSLSLCDRDPLSLRNPANMCL